MTNVMSRTRRAARLLRNRFYAIASSQLNFAHLQIARRDINHLLVNNKEWIKKKTADDPKFFQKARPGISTCTPANTSYLLIREDARLDLSRAALPEEASRREQQSHRCRAPHPAGIRRFCAPLLRRPASCPLPARAGIGRAAAAGPAGPIGRSFFRVPSFLTTEPGVRSIYHRVIPPSIHHRDCSLSTPPPSP